MEKHLLTSNSVTRDFLCGNETLCNSELFVKYIDMLDLVIIDIDLALNRCFFVIMRLLLTYTALCYYAF